MTTFLVNIDVPDLERALAYYAAAFGFAKVAEPYPGVAIVRAGEMRLCLLEKAAGSKPALGAADTRRYDRHWTPVHLDFEVENLAEAVERAVAAGATVEQRFDHPEHGSIAFCADPFGHGFCLLEQRG
jgi:predicted enzyme related to lactoylglutathione lyase